jgi:O-acetyl-ADP-ribose deacetylase (regulator of RNase III)
MPETQSFPADGILFGRTRIDIAVGELVDQPADVLVVAGNQRAMVPAGAASTLWSAAGESVERELRLHAPFEIGTAIATDAGRLEARGVHTIVHAIIAPGLGERPRELAMALALDAAFAVAVERKARKLAVPLLGSSANDPQERRLERAEQILEALVSTLRTRRTRIERALIVSRFEDDLVPLRALVSRARERLWTA